MQEIMQQIVGWSDVVTGVATAAAFAVGAYQLWVLNTQQRLEAHNNLTEAERDIWRIGLDHPDISSSIMNAIFSASGRSGSTHAFVSLLFDHYEHIYLLHDKKLITGTTWEAFEGYIVSTLSNNTIRPIWTELKHFYFSKFVEYFDKKLN